MNPHGGQLTILRQEMIEIFHDSASSNRLSKYMVMAI